MNACAILWQRLDRPGHESARVFSKNGEWNLVGSATFAYEQQPCRLDYAIVCDGNWLTKSTRVTGWVANNPVDITIAVGPNQRWTINGLDSPDVAGAFDIDLGFSPSTNLLPIRRLELVTGQVANVRAAWLPFPKLNLVPLDQIYWRTADDTVVYESPANNFKSELKINGDGVVTRYPGLWERAAFA